MCLYGRTIQKKLKDYVTQYKELNDKLSKENPYGVPISTRGWAGNTQVINWAITNYYACKLFPRSSDLNMYIRTSLHFRVYPYSNLSFVTTVGTKSKKVTTAITGLISGS